MTTITFLFIVLLQFTASATTVTEVCYQNAGKDRKHIKIQVSGKVLGQDGKAKPVSLISHATSGKVPFQWAYNMDYVCEETKRSFKDFRDGSQYKDKYCQKVRDARIEDVVTKLRQMEGGVNTRSLAASPSDTKKKKAFPADIEKIFSWNDKPNEVEMAVKAELKKEKRSDLIEDLHIVTTGLHPLDFFVEVLKRYKKSEQSPIKRDDTYELESKDCYRPSEAYFSSVDAGGMHLIKYIDVDGPTKPLIDLTHPDEEYQDPHGHH